MSRYIAGCNINHALNVGKHYITKNKKCCFNDWTVQIRWSIFMNRRRRSERRNDKEIFGGASPHIKRSI